MMEAIKTAHHSAALPAAVLITFMMFFGIDSAGAAWWEMTGTPVPQDTREISKEKRIMMGQEFEYISYESRLSVEQIKDFYQRRLSALGWTPKDYSQDLSKIPGLTAGSSLDKAFGKNQTFEKGDDVIIIGFMPEGAIRDHLARYLFAKGKIVVNAKETERKEEDYLPRLIAKPQKDVVCVYPGAVLSELSETANFFQATYFVAKGDIGSIVEFYKDAMVTRYAWSLVEEKPLQSLDIHMDPQEIQKICPDCGDKIKALKSDLRSETAALLFSNGGGDTCNIVFTKMAAKETALNAFGDTTIILVNYAKKIK